MSPTQTTTNSALLSTTDTGVTISFSGLVFFQRDAQKQCQAHIISFGEHQLTMDIQEIEFDPQTGLPLNASTVELGATLDPAQNIFVTGGVGNGGGQWVKLFLNGQEVLDKENPQTEEDEKDFRWVLNICGDEFGHQSGVQPNFQKITQTVHLTNGVMYAKNLTDDIFASKSFSDSTVRPIGRAAYSVGLDIKLAGEGDAVYLSNSLTQAMNGEGLKLEFKANTRYQVTTNNLCGPPYPPTPSGSQSDFHAHFENISTESNEVFDLIIVGNRQSAVGSDLGQVSADADRKEKLLLDSLQQNCLPAGGEDPPPGGDDPPPPPPDSGP